MKCLGLALNLESLTDIMFFQDDGTQLKQIPAFIVIWAFLYL